MTVLGTFLYNKESQVSAYQFDNLAGLADYKNQRVVADIFGRDESGFNLVRSHVLWPDRAANFDVKLDLQGVSRILWSLGEI